MGERRVAEFEEGSVRRWWGAGRGGEGYGLGEREVAHLRNKWNSQQMSATFISKRGDKGVHVRRMTGPERKGGVSRYQHIPLISPVLAESL